jgi:hypothetical protein
MFRKLFAEIAEREQALKKRHAELEQRAAEYLASKVSANDVNIAAKIQQDAERTHCSFIREQASPKQKSSTRAGKGIVRLNVGGKRVDIRRSTAMQFDDSPLAWICSGRWDFLLPKDMSGTLQEYKALHAHLLVAHCLLPEQGACLWTLTPNG